MSKKTRAALRRSLLTLSLVLVVAFAAVSGTIAWLQAEAGYVQNTFTVGNITITLDETKVDLYGDPVANAEPTDKNTYKLLPGEPYTKDPKVHVQAGSEPCWLFVKVVNGISDIESQEEDYDNIAAQMKTNGWNALVVDGATIPNVYWHDVVDAREVAKDVAVFGSFTLAGNADVASHADATITIDAYAIQSAHLTSAEAAWKAGNYAGWQN